jgi:hypothetical protein
MQPARLPGVALRVMRSAAEQHQGFGAPIVSDRQCASFSSRCNLYQSALAPALWGFPSSQFSDSIPHRCDSHGGGIEWASR